MVKGQNFAGKALQKVMVALAILPAFCLPAEALQTVVLAWNPVADPTVAGYILSYGSTSGEYNNQIDTGTNSSVAIPGLLEGQTNYFVVAGYNGEGMPGVPSDEIAFVVPGTPAPAQTGGLQVTLNVPGAQWAVDNGALQDSGAIQSGLAIGPHTLTFSGVSGWTTPDSETITVLQDQTNSITATYVEIGQPIGALTVTLNPEVAQWSVDNGALQDSGAVVSRLSVGSHTVSFSALTGWVAPVSQTIDIADGQTNSITATYSAATQTGSVGVTLNAPGAEWCLDGGTFQTNGAVVTALSVGWHTVTFSILSGWIRPYSQIISIVAGQTNWISAIYVAPPQSGGLEMTLLNANGAEWALDGGALLASGAIVQGLSVSSHTVTFSAVSGWIAPTNQTVTVVANQITSITAAYIPVGQTGALTVTLNPTFAQWAVDNGVWQNSSAVVSGLSAGSHIVSFSSVSGWTRPFNQAVSVVATQTNSINAAYVALPQTGMVEVTVNAPGAQWAMDGGAEQTNGAVVAGLWVGSHTVSFGTVNGWTTPSNQTISVVANQTNVITAAYVPQTQTGAVEVTLNPTTAQWSLDGGPWQNSGVVVLGLAAGSHSVSFSSITGWVRPFNQTISVAANQTNSVSGTYLFIPQTGSLAVTLNAAGAQWSVDGGTWQDSSAMVSGLSVGSHTITFSGVSGWTPPASQTVSIQANQTDSITANYVALPQTGALQVALNIMDAKWSVDSGVWRNGGAIVTGLSVGSHTVTFRAVRGFTTPQHQTVSVAANQTNSITGTYVSILLTSSGQTTRRVTGTELVQQDIALEIDRRKGHINHTNSVTANQRNAAPSRVYFAWTGRTFNGLFYPDDAVAEGTSGMLSELAVTKNGSYSGKILIGGSNLTISGIFDIAGHATQTIARPATLGGALKLDMTLTGYGTRSTIIGTVSGTNGSPWVASLVAGTAAANAHSSQYSVIFSPTATTPSESAPALINATITNHGGMATITGELADATRFVQTVPISPDGSLPIYVALGANQLLLGWVTNLYTSTPGGEIAWVKAGADNSGNAQQGVNALVATIGVIGNNAAAAGNDSSAALADSVTGRNNAKVAERAYVAPRQSSRAAAGYVVEATGGGGLPSGLGE